MATGRRPAASASNDNRSTTREVVGRAIGQAARLDATPSDSERSLAARLSKLDERLSADRFQLSVVGQFKRGKSSLLNALIGADVLPVGLFPLTSVPTFIQGGENPGLKVWFQEADPWIWSPSGAEELRGMLRDYATEEANPRNIKGVRRIEVTVPSLLLADGLILMDTPGVGSTHRHNTEAAEAALPECDAALMVVSPDPPITEVELDYLRVIRANAATLIIALNKIDTLEVADIPASVAFLTSVLTEAGLPAVEVYPVSARLARTGDGGGDKLAQLESGIEPLRHALGEGLAARRSSLLTIAVAQKSAALVDDLRFENDLALTVLSTPVETLDRRLAEFRTATTGFERERRAAGDQIQGDRRRLLRQLDEDAEALHQRLVLTLSTEVGARAAAGVHPRAAWDEVRAHLPDLLDRELDKAVEVERERLAETLGEHQERADALLGAIRRAAAEVLDIPYRSPAAAEAFEPHERPYWVRQPRETLGGVPMSFVERIIPGRWGRTYAHRRVDDDILQVVTANVENLRWSTRQNLEEALRRFAVDLDQTLRDGVASVIEAIERARSLRNRGAQAASVALSARRARSEALRQARKALDAVAGRTGED